MTEISTVPELVTYALFDLDPRVAEAQRPLHSFLVSLALYGSPGGLDETELKPAVDALLPLEGSITVGQIQDALALHVRLELVLERGEGRYELSEVRRSQLEEAHERLSEKRQAFHDHIVRVVAGRVPELSQDEQTTLYEVLEAQLVEVLQVQSSVVAGAWAEANGFDAGLPELNAREHLKEVANAVVPGGAEQNKLRRTALAFALEDGLSSLPPEGAAYLAALYQRTVALALLQQDPAVRRVKSRLAGERVAYLDANVVLAAMFDADPQHELAREVFELTRVLGAELRVTEFTIEEISARIKDASRWFQQFRGTARLRGVVDDVIVRSYHAATRTTPGLAWAAFVAGYEPPDAWLREHGVTLDREACADTRADARADKVRAALSRIRPKASTRVLETDAFNIVHVTRQRRTLTADEMGNRVWLVSLDRSLAEAERHLVEDGTLPAGASKLARNWVDLLGPCLPPDKEQLSGYVTRLVQSQFSLIAEDPIFVDKDFLLTLTKSRFDVSEVLGSSPERARQILVRLQEDEEVIQLLGDPQPEDDSWNDKLAAAVKKAIEGIEASPEYRAALAEQRSARALAEKRADEERRERLSALREIADLRDSEQALITERDEIRSERDHLADELEAIENLPWWRRLFVKRP